MEIPELLPLKSDIVFKMLFGDARYLDVTGAFLRSALDIPEDEYEGLEIIDPHTERDSPEDKLSILDVRLMFKGGEVISVEVQIRDVPFMAERVAFTTGRNLSRQIPAGGGYGEIKRVVTILIADYNIIKSDDCYSHRFRLYDPDKKVLFTSIMEIRTLELKKLPDASLGDAREEELLDWLRLIRSRDREEIEMLATRTKEMGQAVARLKQLSADERSRMLFEARELFRMDQEARERGAMERGIKEGIEKGIKGGADVFLDFFYAANPKLFRYATGLCAPSDILIRSLLYQIM
jgi:predicted transposase/invertase (TIGR01784 family)